jgi:hypothetical protein
MSSVTYAPADRIIYRQSVMFVVLPTDLSGHLDELRRYCADLEGVEVLVERRAAPDRRQSTEGAPGGTERRVGERRAGARRDPSDDEASRTAADIDFALPRSLRRHAGRITCTWRALPVHFQDAAHEADLLLAAADSDGDARDELRLRYYQRVYASLDRGMMSSHRKVLLADSVFDDLFAHHASNTFSREVWSATSRVTAHRWARHPSS